MGIWQSYELGWKRKNRAEFWREQMQNGFQNQTDFNWDQIKQLHQRFRRLSGDQPTIRPENFDNVLDLEFNPIRNRIIRAFFDNRNLNKGKCGLANEINFQDFLTIIAYFKPLGPHCSKKEAELYRRRKMRFLFHLYDEDCDGLITLQEYRRVVEDLLSANRKVDSGWMHSTAHSIVLHALSEATGATDQPQEDQGITFEEFVKTWQGIDLEAKMQVSFLTL
ncbi:hypothetical protein STEG23_027660 [Scotinomys teguina]